MKACRNGARQASQRCESTEETACSARGLHIVVRQSTVYSGVLGGANAGRLAARHESAALRETSPCRAKSESKPQPDTTNAHHSKRTPQAACYEHLARCQRDLSRDGRTEGDPRCGRHVVRAARTICEVRADQHSFPILTASIGTTDRDAPAVGFFGGVHAAACTGSGASARNSCSNTCARSGGVSSGTNCCTTSCASSGWSSCRS